MTSTTATTTATATSPFQRAVRLQTKRATATSVASAVTSLDGNEKRYWESKFGLDRPASVQTTSASASSSSGSSAPLSAVIVAGTSSVVHQVAMPASSVALSSSGTHDLVDKDSRETDRTLVVACGPRIQLYGTSAQSALNRALSSKTATTTAPITAPDRQIPTGGQPALCAAFRSDGQLLAVGTQGGIKIAQVSSRATLASHATPLGVRAVAWFRSGQAVLAVGDDATRVYKLSDPRGPVRTLRGHGDVVRCGALWQSPSETLAVTGSYDHTVRLWDLTHAEGDDEVVDDDTSNNRSAAANGSKNDDGNGEASSCLSVMVHGAPVEALLLLDRPSEGASRDTRPRPWLVSAGGTVLKVWDLQTGACLSTCSTHHNKTITALCSVPRVALDDEGKVREWRPRILTGGLDGYLGIHGWDPATGTVTPDLYGARFPERDKGITALCGTHDRIVVGTVRGVVYVRQRPRVSQLRKRESLPRAGTYSFFTRGMNAEAGPNDYVVGGGAAIAGEEGKKRKLQDYDAALKQFRYGDALDEALATRAPRVVAAVLEELGRRRGLTIALSNRDEETLEPILAFTVRYIKEPRFASLLVGVSHRLVDIYGDVAGQSETIDELFAKLRNQVAAEARAQKKLLGLVGVLEGLIASAADPNMDDD